MPPEFSYSPTNILKALWAPRGQLRRGRSRKKGKGRGGGGGEGEGRRRGGGGKMKKGRKWDKEGSKRERGRARCEVGHIQYNELGVGGFGWKRRQAKEEIK